ncbi:MAG: hypothetical protein ACYS26_08565 [Planctomycetota bacterium]|jgi:hypothetical protein
MNQDHKRGRAPQRARRAPSARGASAGAIAAGLALAGVLTACGPSAEVDLGEPTVVAAGFQPAPDGVTDAGRFDRVPVSGGMRMPGTPDGGSSLKGTGLTGADRWAQIPVAWSNPTGWQLVEPPRSSMRLIDFQVGGAECTVTALPGGGTLESNVTRWCTQMGIEPLSAAAVARLPQMRLLGAPATYVDLEGSYSNMGAPAVPDARLIGLILIQEANPAMQSDGFAFFVKLAGPKADVDAAEGLFADFCSSLQSVTPGNGGPRNFDPGTDRRRMEGQAPTSGAPSPDGRDSGGGLSWKLPEGWTRGPERTMRVATFIDPDGVPCTLSIFGGTLVDNAVRWLGELGQDLPADGLASFPRIPSLGTEALLIEAAGDHSGMGGAVTADAFLYGTMCDIGGALVFVKYVGPRAQVEPRREEFLSIVRSLQQEGPR